MTDFTLIVETDIPTGWFVRVSLIWMAIVSDDFEERLRRLEDLSQLPGGHSRVQPDVHAGPPSESLPSCDAEAMENDRDRRSIEELVRHNADLCDAQYDPDKLAPLYTDDAVWESSSASGTSDFGTYRGRSQIRNFFAEISAQIVYTHHISMSPQIEILERGRSARGRWNILVLMELADDGAALDHNLVKIMSGTEDHKYQCLDGRWLFSRVNVHTRFDLRVRQAG